MTDPSDADQRKADSGDKEGRRSMADGELRDAVELHSYLKDIGGLMRLPPKESERRSQASRASADSATVPAPARRLRHAVALIGIAAALVVVVFDSALRPTAETSLPAALQGVWRTDAAPYANRRLEITTSSLAFQVGDSTVAVTRHQVVRVRRSAAPAGTLFRVEYLQEGDLLAFSFVWRGAPQPEIRFANQKGLVWTRTGPAGSAPAPGRPAR